MNFNSLNKLIHADAGKRTVRKQSISSDKSKEMLYDDEG